MIRGTWIEHNGKKVWYVDYTQLSGTEFLKCIADTEAALIQDMESSGRKDGLILSDISSSTLGSDIVARLKTGGDKVKPYIEKTAMLGVNTPSTRAFLNFAAQLTRLNIRAFQTKEEALEWLTK